MRLARVLAAVLALAASAAFAGRVDWARRPLERPIPTAAFVGAGDTWVLIHRELIVEATRDGGLTWTHREVLGHRGPSPRSLTLHLPYDGVVDELQTPELWIVKGGRWRAVKFGRSLVEDEAMVQPELATTSRRTLTITTRPVESEERVVATWTRDASTRGIGEQRFWILDDRPTVELEVRAGVGVELVRVLPDGRGGAAVDVGDFRLESLPSAGRVYPDGEAWLPDPATALPHVIVRRADGGPWDWGAIARRVDAWFAEADSGETSPALRRVFEQVAGEASDPFERAGVLAAYVQELRYKGEVWGEGAFRPAPPDETLRTAAGDCKAQVRLLIALLRLAGIDSRPVLCRSGGRLADPPPVPTALAFDHVIVAVRLPGEETRPAALVEGPGSGWVLFDPTDRLTPFGEPPPDLEGTMALWVSSTEGRVVRLATRRPGVHAVTASLDATAGAAGDLALDLDLEGDAALLHRLVESGAARSSEERLADEIGTTLQAAVPGVRVESARLRRPAGDEGGSRVGLVASARVDSATVRLGEDRLALSAPIALARSVLDLPDVDRPAGEGDLEPGTAWSSIGCVQPFHFNGTAEIRVTPPEGWHLAAGTAAELVDGDWRLVGSIVDGVWRLAVDLPRGRFDDATCERRRAALARWSHAVNRPLVLVRDAMP